MSFCGHVSLNSSWFEKYFGKIFTGNQNTFLCAVYYFPGKKSRFGDNLEKYCTAGHATDDNIIRRMRIAF
jgi:hypothetical protein